MAPGSVNRELGPRSDRTRMEYLPLRASSDDTAGNRPSGETGILICAVEKGPSSLPEGSNQSRRAGNRLSIETPAPFSDTVKPDRERSIRIQLLLGNGHERAGQLETTRSNGCATRLRSRTCSRRPEEKATFPANSEEQPNVRRSELADVDAIMEDPYRHFGTRERGNGRRRAEG
jgi:hypothetical protein